MQAGGIIVRYIILQIGPTDLINESIFTIMEIMKVDRIKKRLVSINTLLMLTLLLTVVYFAGKMPSVVSYGMFAVIILISVFNILVIREVRRKTGGSFWYVFLEFVSFFIIMMVIFQAITGFKICNQDTIIGVILKLKNIF